MAQTAHVRPSDHAETSEVLNRAAPGDTEGFIPISPLQTIQESWTIEKAAHRRIDAFELWCWRRLLRVPWTVRSSNQSILKEINPEYSLEGLMLKLQYFGYPMRRANSLEKTLMLGKI